MKAFTIVSLHSQLHLSKYDIFDNIGNVETNVTIVRIVFEFNISKQIFA